MVNEFMACENQYPYDRARRVVVKCGSSTLTTSEGAIDEAYIRDLVHQISYLKEEGLDVVLVSSGAIAAGLEILDFSERPKEIPTLQACASVGQAALINTYARIFAEKNLNVGQLLITRTDVAERHSYIHAHNTINRLLELGIVPIINENDSVSVDEITSIGDNDTLASLTAALIDADLVVLMSDIDSLYTADPRTNPDATPIPRVDEVTDEIVQSAGGAGSSVGTGGMYTKVRAARYMMLAGIPLIVCDGRQENVLVDAALGKQIGTRFCPHKDSGSLSARKLWIALATKDAGKIIVDEGAVQALRYHGSSLLPVGVRAVEGSFDRGDAVQVQTESGVVVGRGLTSYSSVEVSVTRGMTLEMVARVYRSLDQVPLIHRDELVVF